MQVIRFLFFKSLWVFTCLAAPLSMAIPAAVASCCRHSRCVAPRLLCLQISSGLLHHSQNSCRDFLMQFIRGLCCALTERNRRFCSKCAACIHQLPPSLRPALIPLQFVVPMLCKLLEEHKGEVKTAAVQVLHIVWHSTIGRGAAARAHAFAAAAVAPALVPRRRTHRRGLRCQTARCSAGWYI
jgi:hypothetical protein